MADQPEEKPTNTEEFGCLTNPFTPEPVKKGSTPPAANSDKE